MATATLEEIVIENNKAIEHLTIPLPVGGGLVVLTGDNGCGKSEALQAVRALMGDKDAKKHLEPRDGTKKGSVEGCGVTISLGRVNRETGELTVAGLEDRLDISDLVDPGIDDPNAADARRLKSLLKVSGVTANIDLFSGLLGDTYEIDESVLKERDLIKMAGGVKRHFEAQARTIESQAESAKIQATACLKATEGVDLDAESDATVLDANYRQAVKTAETLDADAKAVRAAMRARNLAQMALDAAADTYKGPTSQQASDLYSEANERVKDANDGICRIREQIEELQTQLRLAIAERETRESKKREAEAVMDAAAQHEETIAEWQATLSQPLPHCPTDEDIDDANAAVSMASEAMGQGGIVRNAKAKRTEAGEWTVKHRRLAAEAEQHRDAAKGVDEVLSDLVGTLGCAITVGSDDKGMRLMVDHKTRGMIPFAELSAGEKYAVVIPIAIKAVGENGVFVIPQEAYEGLQPKVRTQIVRLLKGTHVTAITAECADGPLSANEVTA